MILWTLDSSNLITILYYEVKEKLDQKRPLYCCLKVQSCHCVQWGTKYTTGRRSLYWWSGLRIAWAGASFFFSSSQVDISILWFLFLLTAWICGTCLLLNHKYLSGNHETGCVIAGSLHQASSAHLHNVKLERWTVFMVSCSWTWPLM